MNALVFLYRRVLKMPLGEEIDAVRAQPSKNVPVVLTREETARVIPLVEGVSSLVVRLLYGSGLRIMEAVRLRVKDIDFKMRQLTVRKGKGDKDRVTTFPGSLTGLLEEHLKKVKAYHKKDLVQGHGAVWLPYALERKYPKANREWGWQWVFPARELSEDPLSGVTRRQLWALTSAPAASSRRATSACPASSRRAKSFRSLTINRELVSGRA